MLEPKPLPTILDKATAAKAYGIMFRAVGMHSRLDRTPRANFYKWVLPADKVMALSSELIANGIAHTTEVNKKRPTMTFIEILTVPYKPIHMTNGVQTGFDREDWEAAIEAAKR